jgi:hypothetical protein
MSEAAEGERAQVWYGSESDPFRAMHDVFEVVRPDGERQLYECGGWSGKPESAVQAALVAAGFVGGEPLEVAVRAIDPEDGVEMNRHFGFYVEPAELGAVEDALRDGLRGALGGYTGVLMGQSGFHRSVYAFTFAWKAAGKPPVLLAHPSSARSGRKGHGGPGTLIDPHKIDRRARLALQRFRELTRGS